MESLLLRDHDGGVTIQVRVKTRAKSNVILGVHGGALKVAVSAVPQNGEANDAIRRLLGKIIGIAASSIEVLSGLSSHQKVILLRGKNPDEVRRALQGILDQENAN